MKKEQDARRSFLKHILAGSAVVAGTVSAVRPVKARSGPKCKSENEVLYHESEEFKRYYKTLKS